MNLNLNYRSSLKKLYGGLYAYRTQNNPAVEFGVVKKQNFRDANYFQTLFQKTFGELKSLSSLVGVSRTRLESRLSWSRGGR